MRASVALLGPLLHKIHPTQPTAENLTGRSVIQGRSCYINCALANYSMRLLISYHTILASQASGLPSLLHWPPCFTLRSVRVPNVLILSDKHLRTKPLYQPSVCAEQLSALSLGRNWVSITGASIVRLITILVRIRCYYASVLLPSRNYTCWHMLERELHAIQQQALAAKDVVRILILGLIYINVPVSACAAAVSTQQQYLKQQQQHHSW